MGALDSKKIDGGRLIHTLIMKKLLHVSFEYIGLLQLWLISVLEFYTANQIRLRHLLTDLPSSPLQAPSSSPNAPSHVPGFADLDHFFHLTFPVRFTAIYFPSLSPSKTQSSLITT